MTGAGSDDVLKGPVLAATDFSDAADAALRQGAEIAGSLGTRLIVCHVLPEAYRVRVLFPQDAGFDAAEQGALEAKAREALHERLTSTLAGVKEIAVEIESGTPHAGILSIAERAGVGLVVLGPGRTAERVARSSGRPVLIARPSPIGGSVLGATDFSDPSLPAIRVAAEEAARRHVRLRVVHCVHLDAAAFVPAAPLPGMLDIPSVPPSMIEELDASAREQLAAALASAGVTGEPIVQRRPPALGIIEAAQDAPTALIVVGTRGRTGLARLALGSVAEDVVGGAPCSVLVVPLHPAH